MDLTPFFLDLPLALASRGELESELRSRMSCMTLESLKESVCRLPVIGLLVRAVLKDHQDHAKDMAASIAYFSFFSCFIAVRREEFPPTSN